MPEDTTPTPRRQPTSQTQALIDELQAMRPHTQHDPDLERRRMVLFTAAVCLLETQRELAKLG